MMNKLLKTTSITMETDGEGCRILWYREILEYYNEGNHRYPTLETGLKKVDKHIPLTPQTKMILCPVTNKPFQPYGHRTLQAMWGGDRHVPYDAGLSKQHPSPIPIMRRTGRWLC